ncbi:hypothetical protein V8C44DRAFT_339741 [Trichoderma aethiopicum]
MFAACSPSSKAASSPPPSRPSPSYLYPAMPCYALLCPSYAQRRPERPVPAGRQSVPQQLEPAID